MASGRPRRLSEPPVPSFAKERGSMGHGTRFMDGVVISPIREGWLTKQGHRFWRTWRKRWFVLTKDFLIYAVSPKALRSRGRVDLNAITSVAPVPLRGVQGMAVFTIPGHKDLMIVGEGLPDWMVAIRQACRDLAHEAAPPVPRKVEATSVMTDPTRAALASVSALRPPDSAPHSVSTEGKDTESPTGVAVALPNARLSDLVSKFSLADRPLIVGSSLHEIEQVLLFDDVCSPMHLASLRNALTAIAQSLRARRDPPCWTSAHESQLRRMLELITHKQTARRPVLSPSARPLRRRSAVDPPSPAEEAVPSRDPPSSVAPASAVPSQPKHLIRAAIANASAQAATPVPPPFTPPPSTAAGAGVLPPTVVVPPFDETTESRSHAAAAAFGLSVARPSSLPPHGSSTPLSDAARTPAASSTSSTASRPSFKPPPIRTPKSVGDSLRASALAPPPSASHPPTAPDSKLNPRKGIIRNWKPSTVSAVSSGSSAPVLFDELFELGEELGRGAFSVVRKTRHRKSGREFAVKILDRASMDSDHVAALLSEVSTQRVMRHPNIVRLVAFFDNDPDMFYLVTELCTGGELFHRIVAQERFSERQAAGIVLTMLDAIAYFHRLGVVHRDIKPENILLQDDRPDAPIKIADFGFSKQPGKEESLRSLCGSPNYLAPEIILNKPYGQAVDMWSLGVVTYILLAGYMPFEHENREELFKRIVECKYSFPDREWSGISADAKDFIQKLLVVDPAKRLSAVQALSHPWITKTDLSEAHLSRAVKKLRHFHSRRAGHHASHTVARRRASAAFSPGGGGRGFLGGSEVSSIVRELRYPRRSGLDLTSPEDVPPSPHVGMAINADPADVESRFNGVLEASPEFLKTPAGFPRARAISAPDDREMDLLSFATDTLPKEPHLVPRPPLESPP
jgi:calcium/calmodulin-dependent protein kinase I